MDANTPTERILWQHIISTVNEESKCKLFVDARRQAASGDICIIHIFCRDFFQVFSSFQRLNTIALIFRARSLKLLITTSIGIWGSSCKEALQIPKLLPQKCWMALGSFICQQFFQMRIHVKPPRKQYFST
jgi:hypothetical protein